MPEPTDPGATPTQFSAHESDQPEQRDLTGKVCGDFRILRRLGQGGMGQVFLAEQLSLKRKVALKFLRPELSANKTSLERFKREAEAVARATHANIVQIYSIGDFEGLNFMALEYVEGRNLREFIEKKGPPEIQLGLRIISQVASALQLSSELGIVHRDIKPENILINRKGDVKVTDFGLSRHFTQASNLTESRIAMGTPLYMSPEQVEGKPVDHRTDLYSLGATCYHLFAGHPPFKGQTPFEVALQHVNKEPKPLAEIRPDLPADLCGLVHKLMAKRPEMRYQTGREVARDASRLRDALVASGGHFSATVLGGLTPSGTMLNFGSTEGLENLSGASLGKARSRRHPWLFASLLAGGLTVGLLAGWLMTPPPTIAFPNSTKVLEGKAQEVPTTVKELFSAKEREKELQRRVQDHLRSPLDRGIGLETIMDLGVLYLRERRLDEAETYFKDLERGDRRLPQYRFLSHLGQAIVLSFRDRPAESNVMFLETFDSIEKLEARLEKLPNKFPELKKDKLPAAKNALVNFWGQHVGWREQTAQALNRNLTNAPATYPADSRMHVLRKPPTPGAKVLPL